MEHLQKIIYLLSLFFPVMFFFALGLWFAWLLWFKNARAYDDAVDEHKRLVTNLNELYDGEYALSEKFEAKYQYYLKQWSDRCDDLKEKVEEKEERIKSLMMEKEEQDITIEDKKLQLKALNQMKEKLRSALDTSEKDFLSLRLKQPERGEKGKGKSNTTP